MCSSRRLSSEVAACRCLGLALCALVILTASGPLAAPLGRLHTVVAAVLLVPAVVLTLAASVADGRVIGGLRRRLDHAGLLMDR